MKKFLAIALIAATFAACNDNSSEVESTRDSSMVTPAPSDAPATIDTTSTSVDTTTVR